MSDFVVGDRVRVVSISDDTGNTDAIGKIGEIAWFYTESNVGQSEDDPFMLVIYDQPKPEQKLDGEELPHILLGDGDFFWSEELEHV